MSDADPSCGSDSPTGVTVPGPGAADLATLAFTYFAVGVTVSVTLLDRDVPPVIVAVAALTIFSATSELAFVAVEDGGGSFAIAVLSGWLVASRFGLLAAVLGRHFGGSSWHRAAAAVTSLDPNVALAVQQRDTARVRKVFWQTATALMGGFWIGSAVGIALGNVLGDTDRFGLDVVFPAALLAIVGGMLRRRDGLMAGILGAVVCLVLVPVAPAGLPILASVIGAVVAGSVTAARAAP